MVSQANLNRPQKTVYYLCGPTASGKTSLSIDIAKKLPNTRFINADTMQMYSGLGELASSPNETELQKIDHRLFGVLDLSEDCNREQWLSMAIKEIKAAFNDGKTPILVGGSRSFMATLAKAAYDINLNVNLDNAITYPQESSPLPPFPFKLASIVLMPDVDTISKLVKLDVERRFNACKYLIQQVLNSGADTTKPGYWTIGFQELSAAFLGQTSFDQALNDMTEKTLRYASEQVTLFNRFFDAVTQQFGPSQAIKIKSMKPKERTALSTEFIYSNQDTESIGFGNHHQKTTRFSQCA